MSLPGLRDRARAIAELPALGLLTLAGMTSDLWKSTYRGIEQCNDASIDLIRRDRPDLVAISALTASIEEAYTLCRRLREHGIPTVIGGLHATACPDEAEQYAEEAEEFADLAEELEEEIQELFDESGLDDEDFEDFKQGLLDELFGEDSEFSDQLDEKERRLKKKLALRLKNRVKRGTVRCVNWATGKIKSFPEDETIGGKWIPITLFFSPFESDGNQIVVDKTIAGAVEMAQAVGITVSFNDKTSADFATTDEEFFLALKRMLMFTVTQKLGGIHINY